NDIPLRLGANAIPITIKTQDGVTVTKNVTISKVAGGGIHVTADQTYGLQSAEVTFRIAGTENLQGTIEFDLNGDGAPDFSGSASETFRTFTFSAPGYFRTRVIVRDIDSVEVYRTYIVIYTFSPNDQYQLLLNVFETMKERLKNGRIDEACTALSEIAAQKYRRVFVALGANLPNAVDGLGVFRASTMSLPTSEFVLSQENTPGKHTAYFLNFIRGHDGIWRIHGM
ncbi:MAG: hypothetical protein ABI604_11130, partial [Nitrospirota bacterium]